MARSSPGDGARLAVVIATRDRPDALARCLDALIAAERPEGWEIAATVVDNGARGPSAAAVVAAAAERARASGPGLDLRCRREEARGLSRARNRAFSPDPPDAEAVAILDDDVLAEPGYLRAAVDLLAARPETGVFGGRVTLHDPRDLPVTVLMWPKPREMSTRVNVLGFLLGCNMLVRREVFERVGLFDPDLGAGAPTRSAEDTDFYYRAWRAGFGVRYEPSLAVAHDHGRRDPAAIAGLEEGYAFGAGAFFCKHLLFGRDPAAAALLARTLWRDLRVGRGELAKWRPRWRGALAYRRLRRDAARPSAAR